MELYVLGDTLERQHLYDRYNSLIWTERARAHGDFQLVIPSDSTTKSRLRRGAYVALDESKRMMQIETTTEKNGLWTCSGRSIESLFMYRSLNIGNQHETEDPSKFGFNRSAVGAMYKIYYIAMGIEFYQKYGVQNAAYVPFIGPTAEIPLPFGDIAVDSTSQAWDSEPEPLYDMLTRIAVEYNLGFAYTRNHTTNLLGFSVYSGYDRTSEQTARPAIIFSPELDTLNDPSTLSSIENWANAAFVSSIYTYATVHAKDQDPDLARGLNLRELVFRPKSQRDQQDGQTVRDSWLDTRDDEIRQAYDLLNQHQRIDAIDGTVPITKYKYDRDYFLNDRVEMRVNGSRKFMRVAEHTYTSDAQGDRSFPTLVENY